MLTNEIMGVLALAVVWINALLIAGAAWQDLRDVRAWARRGANAKRGKVHAAHGADDTFAMHAVEQVGRAAGDGSEIAFADRAFTGRVFGGAVKTDAGELVAFERERGELWVDPAVIASRAESESSEAVQRALVHARKARGFVRTVEVPVRVGDVVWVEGDWVSTIDPVAWARARSRLVALFIVGALAAAALSTFVALWPPVFGAVSTLGGAMCLGYFLAVQPLGVLVREKVRTPSRAVLRGRWRAKQAPAQAAAA